MSATQVAFISGHLDVTLKEFEQHYKDTIDEAVRLGHKFVIGDARGADSLAQAYLVDLVPHHDVTIFHMFTSARVNVGKWSAVGGYSTDDARDAAMTYSSTYDIAWLRDPERNSGTRRNLERRKQKDLPSAAENKQPTEEELKELLKEMKHLHNELDQRFVGMNQSFDRLGSKLDNLDKSLDNVSNTIDGLNGLLDKRTDSGPTVLKNCLLNAIENSPSDHDKTKALLKEFLSKINLLIEHGCANEPDIDEFVEIYTDRIRRL